MILLHIQCLLSQLKMFVGVSFEFSFTNLKTGILLCSFFRNFQSGWWTAPCIQKHPNMGPLIAPHMLDPRVFFGGGWDCSVLYPQQNQGERNVFSNILTCSYVSTLIRYTSVCLCSMIGKFYSTETLELPVVLVDLPPMYSFPLDGWEAPPTWMSLEVRKWLVNEL